VSVPTDERAIVRLLLRGLARVGVGAMLRVSSYPVIALGPPDPARWPDAAEGDVEGIIWTTPRQAHTIAASLRSAEHVVEARPEIRTIPPPPT